MELPAGCWISLADLCERFGDAGEGSVDEALARLGLELVCDPERLAACVVLKSGWVPQNRPERKLDHGILTEVKDPYARPANHFEEVREEEP